MMLNTSRPTSPSSCSSPKMSNTINTTNDHPIKSHAPTNNSHTSSTIAKHLNWAYDLYDENSQLEYRDFNREQGLTKIFLAFMVYKTLIALPTAVYAFIEGVMAILQEQHYDDRHDVVSIFTVSVAIIDLLLTLTVVVSGWQIIRYCSPEILQYLNSFLGKPHECLSQWFCNSYLRTKQPLHSPCTAEVSGHSNPTISAQRIEISIFREISGRTTSVHNSIRPALSTSTRRVTPTPSFFAMVPNTSSKCASTNNTPRTSSKIQPSPFPSALNLEESTYHPTKPLQRNPSNISDGSTPVRLDRIAIYKLIYLISFETLLLWNFVVGGISPCDATTSLGAFGTTYCDLREYYVGYHCLILILLPYLLFVALPDLPITSIWCCLVCTILILVSITLSLSTYQALLWILTYSLFTVAIIVDAQVHKVFFFLATRKLGGILEETERNAIHNHAQEMRHMIANVAHDLKTPLASFLTGMEYIQMLMDETKNGVLTAASLESCVNNMRNTHSFMLMTINRCIDYTKASKGLKLVPKYETVHLHEALELPIHCMLNMQHRINIVLNPIPKEICSHLISDKQWLQENVLCLLSNAVKYSAEGSVTINVCLEEYVSDGWKMCMSDKVHDSGDEMSHASNRSNGGDSHSVSDKSKFPPMMPYLRIEVEDTGIGMSEEAMASLFNPFKQTQRLAGGTGLGLYSLAKRLEALHGFYGVMKRRDGKGGSLFWFAIPYKPDTVYAQHSLASKPIEERLDVILEKVVHDNSSIDRTHLIEKCPDCVEIESSKLRTSFIKESSTSTTASAADRPLRILLVDDSHTILKMSTMMLKRFGYDIITAENGAIAVKLVEEKLASNEKFDVILMDLQMPVMDGLEATQRIRQLEGLLETTTRLKHVIIGMSANSDHETSVSAYEVGVDSFLPKPFRVETFRSTLNTLM